MAAADPRRAVELDPKNRRRLVRALEIIEKHGTVPVRSRSESRYEPDWIVMEPDATRLRARLDQTAATTAESAR